MAIRCGVEIDILGGIENGIVAGLGRRTDRLKPASGVPAIARSLEIYGHVCLNVQPSFRCGLRDSVPAGGRRCPGASPSKNLRGGVSMLADGLLRTTVVGSYPQPDWLIDKEILRSQLVPRVRAEKLWRIPPVVRDEALRDATLLAIRDMELAASTSITDGEIARESYSNHFSSSLDGVDLENPAIIISRIGRETRVHRVTGPIRRRGSIEVEAARFLRGEHRSASRK